jgi:prolyl oligopeptidase PreP (S9A serine peptidase family)
MGLRGRISADGRYLVINVWQGTDVRNRLFYQDLQTDGAIVELIAELEATYAFVGNDGPVLYCRTNLDTPRGRLIALDTERPERQEWRMLVPEGADLLESALMVHDEFILLYVHDAHHVLKRCGLDGTPLGEIELPALGSIGATGAFSTSRAARPTRSYSTASGRSCTRSRCTGLTSPGPRVSSCSPHRWISRRRPMSPGRSSCPAGTGRASPCS